MLEIDLEADARNVPDTPALHRVAELVSQWELAGGELARLEERMELLKTARSEIEKRHLPGAMQEAGISSFKTTNGRSVEIKQVVNGSIPALTSIEKAKGDLKASLFHRRNLCYQIVKSHWPGLIKTELSLSLGRGELALAGQVAELIRNQFKLSPTIDETIHPQTLNSHFGELLEQGRIGDVPADVFSLYVGPIAKIK